MGAVCGSLLCPLFPSILHTVAIVLSTIEGLTPDGCLRVRGARSICSCTGLAARGCRRVAPPKWLDSLEGSLADY